MDFGQLFKKYRLKSEFETLSDFGRTLADKGFIYEDSLFSHWQKNSRIPRDRDLLLKIIAIFIEHEGLNSLKDINSFLESAKQGYLTDTEMGSINLKKIVNIPFQVPAPINDFVGREKYIGNIKHLLKDKKNVLIRGIAGSGKTVLAIRIGHLLRDQYPDGVLWFRMDTSSQMDILASIAYTYGEDISHIRDIENRASIVRSLLSYKKCLIILDNFEKDNNLLFFIPNSQESSLLITSQYNNFADTHVDDIYLNRFTLVERNILFNKILGEKYVSEKKEKINELSLNVGYLPLAIHIIAKQLKSKVNIDYLLETLNKNKLKLDQFSYSNKNLYTTLEFSSNQFSKQLKKVFFSIGIFHGEDFSLEAIAFINDLTKEKILNLINKLADYSLIEISQTNRYRVHPLIRKYIYSKKMNKIFYLKLAEYYKIFILEGQSGDVYTHSIIRKEYENILFLSKQLYKDAFWKELIDLWKYLNQYFWDLGYLDEVSEFTKLLYKKASKLGDNYTKVAYCIHTIASSYYWKGEIRKAEKYNKESLNLSILLKNDGLIANAKIRLAKNHLSLGEKYYPECIKIFKETYKYFLKDSYKKITITRYLGESYILLKNTKKAEKYFYRAINLAKKINGFNFEIVYDLAMIYMDLGCIYMLQNDMVMARNFFLRSKNFQKKYNRKFGANIWSNIGLGLLYEELGNTFEAKEHFKIAREEMELLGIKKNIHKISLLIQALQEKIEKSKLYSEYIR